MTERPRLELNQIGQISINAHDVGRAEAFYRDQLSLKHLYSFSDMAFFQCGGIRLMVAKPERRELDHPSSILYSKVENIFETHEWLLSRGVRFVDSPHVVAEIDTFTLWLAEFCDSEGNILCLMSEKRK
jgi:predicted enzyme related to lactoylglutathione lyase